MENVSDEASSEEDAEAPCGSGRRATEFVNGDITLRFRKPLNCRKPYSTEVGGQGTDTDTFRVTPASSELAMPLAVLSNGATHHGILASNPLLFYEEDFWCVG